LELSREKPELLTKLKCVILDGFHTFTPTQREFIRLFAEHCGEVIVTLDYVEGRPDAFSSVEPTFRFLAELPAAVVNRVFPPEDGTGALGHVRRSLFNADPPKSEITEGVTILVGATPAMEVELVAGEIRKLVRERGFAFSEIGIIARSLRPYQRLTASTFEEYRIPVAPHIYPLAESALAQTVLNRLHDALANSSAADPRRAVEALMRDVPLRDTEHTLQEHFAAWRSIVRIMDRIVAAQGIVSVGDFAQLLDIGIRTGIYRTPGVTEDGVTIESAGGLRGRKFRAALVIGLEDGAFPRRGREDQFINDWERAILNDHLHNAIPLRSVDNANERYLLYTAVSSAQERLYLSYSGFDSSGRRNRPSAYLDDVGALFAREIPRITREPRDVVPPLDRVETAKELTARTILDCCTAEDERSRHAAVLSYNLLLERGCLGPSDFEWLSEGETTRIPPEIAELLALDQEE
ncbi:MAG: exodeoxyribonuclease V subunit gamma, partial [Armatimonadetes bacterium]|nr:exodeoxyribonuclease V subunit gamma [Armatimonadota bacterium]